MNPAETSVTGVLVTGKTKQRYGLAMKAIESWHNQKYPGPRELLIINDHPTSPLIANKATIPEGIREVRIRGRRSLGELRNIGIEQAKHSYIVQWDDDDYSHPNRLSYQVTNTEPGHMSIMKWQINLHLLTGRAYANNGNSISCHAFPGTMLWPRDLVTRFPAIGKAEDTKFVLAAKKIIGLDILNNDPVMYTRLYHGKNTWSEKHVTKPKPGSRDLKTEQQEYAQNLLAEVYSEIREELKD